ncbi:hypothetical protein C8R43DRAFT_994308, partial [Mycena crocata]
MAAAPLLTVEIHSFASPDESSSWPPEISSIYCTCCLPLPSWCATGPHRTVSDKISPLLAELAELPTFLYEDSSDIPEGELHDFFDVSLSTVADVRSLVKIYGPSRSALPFIFRLLRILAHSCAKGAITIADTLFVRPRITVPDGIYEGTATMLLCHPVTSLEDSEGVSMDVDIDEEIPEYSSRDPEPMNLDSGSDDSSTGPQIPSLDLPLEAQILPCYGKQVLAALPLLCVTDHNNIVELVSSVACQRFVWGITEPVVGFAVSETGAFAKLVLSWVDHITHVVHVVCPAHDPDLEHSPPPGIFDFTNPASVLRFSRLVLSLSPQFAIISRQTVTSFENNRLDWRSDNREIPSGNFETWRDRVALWVRDVARSSSKSSFDLPPTPPPSPPSKKSTVSSDEDMPPKPRSPKDVPPKPSDKSPSSPDDQGTGEVTKLAKPKSTRSHKSNSDFANVSAEGITNNKDRPDTATWAFDRNVLFSASITFHQKEEEHIDFNKTLESYKKICGFLWCLSWDAKSCRVPPSLSEFKDLLFRQAEVWKARAPRSETFDKINC